MGPPECRGGFVHGRPGAEGSAIRLPSLDQLRVSAAAVARRFPEVVLCAAVAGCAGVAAVDSEPDAPWWGLMRTAGLGLPLFFTLTLLGERHGWGVRVRWLATALGAALLLGLHHHLDPWVDEALAQRYGHLTVTLHLAVSVVPYVAVAEPYGFWQYNRALLFRFLLATLYSGVLFAGLALALAAIDNLLGVEIPDAHYGRLFFMIAWCFHPVFFLAGVPSDFGELERSRHYPAALRILSVYVMLPLVAVYVTILTLYLGKIVVTGTWPSGWTGYLVSSLAAAGIFSLLVVHPERIAREQGWIDRYALSFWIAIVPAAVMVLLALWQRIEQYGITERRYLLGVLAVWLAVIALHRVITRTRDIRAVPLTLAVIGAVTFAGPWSAYAVAEHSQAGRVAAILATRGVLGEGRGVGPGTVEIPYEEWEQVEEAVAYLVDNHGVSSVERWYEAEGTGITGLAGVEDRDERVERVMAALRVRPGPREGPVDIEAGDRGAPLSTEGFDLVIVASETGSAEVDGRELRFRISESGFEIAMWLGGREEGRGSLLPVIGMAEERPVALARSGSLTVPRSSLVLEVAGEALSARLVFKAVQLEHRDGILVATGFDLDAVLLRRKEGIP